MRIYLETMGCRLNYAEIAMLGRQLADAGHELADSAVAADLCVLNSCTVTGEAARKSRQLVRQMARANPRAQLVVTGCYATLEGESAAALPNVALVVGNDRKEQLLDLVGQLDKEWENGKRSQPAGGGFFSSDNGNAASVNKLSCSADVISPSAADLPGRTRAFIKIQDGCHNRCTFCIVTVARGDERSRPVAEIVAEINALHGQGFQEAVLTGVHLAAYGRPHGAPSGQANGRAGGDALAELIDVLLAETTIPRIRLSSLEPFDLSPAFFDLWAVSDGRLMPHLHLPAQSGSDRVLQRMARRNGVAEYENLLAAARARIPGLTITTDLIAGFPGETEADFAETVAFARRAGFAHIHAFPYSARAGTAAARFSGQTPKKERQRRSRVLNALDRELGAEVRAEFVGWTRPVLWENRVNERTDNGANPAQDGGVFWSGLTDNYLRVLTLAPGTRDLHNLITPVRLTDLAGGQLWGVVQKESV